MPKQNYIVKLPTKVGVLIASGLLVAGCSSPPSVEYDGGQLPSFRDVSARPSPDVPNIPPPEREETRSFLTPRAGGRYVYVANPLRDSVAVIDSQTLGISSIEVGRRPTTLNTMDGRDECIVLNSGANTASILRTVNGTTTTAQVPTLAGANAIAISSDARHAIVYFDSTVPDVDNRRANFQDITLISLQPGMDRAVQLTVGFRTLDVLFSQDGAAAYVLTEDGISIIRFADIMGPTILPSVSLQDNRVEEVPVVEDAGVRDVPTIADVPTVADVVDAAMDAAQPDANEQDANTQDGTDDVLLMDAATEVISDGFSPPDAAPPSAVVRGPVTDVSLTQDGRWAVARVDTMGLIRLIDLRNRTVQTLNLGAEVTDLDLSSNGAFAIAVQRGVSRVLRIPIPGAFDGSAAIRRTEFMNEFVGSVTIAPNNNSALLYTTATEVRRVLVMDLANNSGTASFMLRKAVRAVTFAPDSRSALIVHTHVLGNPNERGIPLETQIDRSPGYSLLDPQSRFVKLQLTETDVGPFALVPGGGYAFLLFRDDVNHLAFSHRVNLRSFEVTPSVLGSPPSSVGAVPATERVFIGQDHPEGRISFINWNTGATESLTGFELNSRIVR